jgi:hypothetical protein
VRSASEYIIGAIEREPAVGGGTEAGDVLGQAGVSADEVAGSVVADDAHGAVREHDPRQLAGVLRRRATRGRLRGSWRGRQLGTGGGR